MLNHAFALVLISIVYVVFFAFYFFFILVRLAGSFSDLTLSPREILVILSVCENGVFLIKAEYSLLLDSVVPTASGFPRYATPRNMRVMPSLGCVLNND